MADEHITSRKDLSFTATSDAPVIRSNWNVHHAKGDYWGDTVRFNGNRAQRRRIEKALKRINAKNPIATRKAGKGE